MDKISEEIVESLTLQEAVEQLVEVEDCIKEAGRRKRVLMQKITEAIESKDDCFSYGKKVRVGDMVITRESAYSLSVDVVKPAPELVEVLVPARD